MNHVETTKIKSVPHKKLERGMIIKADDNCIGKKRTLRTGCGTLHCEAFFDPDTGQLLVLFVREVELIFTLLLINLNHLEHVLHMQ